MAPKPKSPHSLQVRVLQKQRADALREAQRSGVVQRPATFAAKRGKGSYKRRPKHREVYT